MRVQLLKLQSIARRANEKNPRRKHRVCRERGTASTVQRSTTAGAILFEVANSIHIHVKPTSVYGIVVFGAGIGTPGTKGEEVFLKVTDQT